MGFGGEIKSSGKAKAKRAADEGVTTFGFGGGGAKKSVSNQHRHSGVAHPARSVVVLVVVCGVWCV